MAVSTKVIKPMDYLYAADHFDNGISQYYFKIWDNPTYQVYNGTTLDTTFNGSMNWELDYFQSSYRISVSPIGGTTFTSNPSAVIDVSDFKSSSVLELTYTGEFRVDVYNQGNHDLLYRVTSHVSLYWYDKDMNYISYSNSPTVENTGIYGQPSFVWALNNTVDMVIPVNAAYVVPRYAVVFYPPDSGTLYRICSTEYENFTIVVKKDDIVENSLTMQKIEGQLDDLNDKADQIITGDQEQQDNAQDGANTVTDNEQEMDDILAQLDDYEKIDTTSALRAIKNFLEEDGWKDVREVIGPLLDWTHTVTIMLLVLSLINLSIILFGR